ncbi:MAG TPA: hypothetical protein VL156_12620 [Terriglobales bacterium]|nr:hypothetical protein [Terriglobales bacterium]
MPGLITETMPEGVAEEPKNWLQLYVDAMTEKDPYKRLALVRRLRQVPRHDESDETPERSGFRLMPKPASPKPSLPRVAAPKAALRRQKAKAVSKTHKGSARLRSA